MEKYRGNKWRLFRALVAAARKQRFLTKLGGLNKKLSDMITNLQKVASRASYEAIIKCQLLNGSLCGWLERASRQPVASYVDEESILVRCLNGAIDEATKCIEDFSLLLENAELDQSLTSLGEQERRAHENDDVTAGTAMPQSQLLPPHLRTPHQLLQHGGALSPLRLLPRLPLRLPLRLPFVVPLPDTLDLEPFVVPLPDTLDLEPFMFSAYEGRESGKFPQGSLPL